MPGQAGPPHERGFANAAARFAADLSSLGFAAGRLGVAVSGGSDSVALLLLAYQALPGRVAAATVDHGLRAEAAAEAAAVAALCAELGVPHATMVVTVAGRDGPQGNARTARYAALSGWAGEAGVAALATAHHADDQAETLLLRLARGAGLPGLAGVRAARASGQVPVLRPLLGWRREELARIVADAGVRPVSDPANRDPRYDRTHARRLLAETAWIDPARVAASASYLAEAEAALAWTAERLWTERASAAGQGLELDVSGMPAEIVRRLLLRAIEALGASTPDGPALASLTARMRAGETATLAGLRFAPRGEIWSISVAPPRRGH